ncbi:CPBP family intramembrane glutamic endopeptidase [Desnuesiella massiliensis]|uniref:CPBP family intramembrane glutamic endopeptidase n=1 Tax=Desnuesiella massiliensis TaxID=1650662 RepID=UPI0006E28BB9|nr:CPBP family intramembrane glutamic endopeptidase [Desnuesiella massiliensis]
MFRKIFSKKNRLFYLASESKFIPDFFISIFLLIIGFTGVFPYVLQSVLRYIFKLNVRGLKNGDLIFSLENLIIPLGLTTLSIFIWVVLVERRNIGSLGFEKEQWIKKYLRGFLIGIFMLSICSIIYVFLGAVEYDEIAAGGGKVLWGVLILLLGWIIQGAAEEIMTRGWLMQVIGVRYNMPLGIIISSTIFGAMHLFNPGVSKLSLVNLVLFGVFAALYAIWEEGLWGICALHSAWNWAQGNIFGFKVSGAEPAGGTLLAFRTTGSDIITGGAFGPEGGLVVSLILTIGILVLAILISKRDYDEGMDELMKENSKY